VQLFVNGVEPRGVLPGMIERQFAGQAHGGAGATVRMLEVRQRTPLDRVLGETPLGGLLCSGRGEGGSHNGSS